jgi:hypothetical protein
VNVYAMKQNDINLQKKFVKGQASYFKASALKRWLIKTFSRFEITMLYEVSFSSTRFSKQRHQQINQHLKNKRRAS